MPTRFGWIVIIGTAGAYAAAAILDNAQFYQLTSVLLTLLVLAALWVWLSGLGMRCQLSAPGQVEVGQPLSIRLSIVSRWIFPRSGFLLNLIFPPASRSHPMLAIWVQRLPAVGSVTSKIDVPCRYRGAWDYGPVSFRWQDPLGLFYRIKALKEKWQVEVLPRQVSLERFPLLEAGAGFRDPERTLPTPGYSNDFYAVRQYESGDSPRWIHWLSTARMQRLMTRQFQAPVQRRTLVVLYGRTRDRGLPAQLAAIGKQAVSSDSRRSEAFELATSVAATVARFSIETDHETGLLVLGKPETLILPTSGNDSLRQVMQALASAQPGGAARPADLEQMLYSQVESIILITPFWHSGIQQIVQELSQTRAVLTAVLVGDHASVVNAVPGKGTTEHHHSTVDWLDRHGIPVCVVNSAGTLRHDLENPLNQTAAQMMHAIRTTSLSRSEEVVW